VSKIQLAILFVAFMILIGGSAGTSDSATWKASNHTFEGKDLPKLGLQSSTGLSLSYSMSSVGLPSKVDWRTTPYGTRVSPINDQGNCGACVAYAIVGQIEAANMIASNTSKAVDLAEMEFFSHGGNCGTGWIFEKAYPVAASPGIMTQTCYDSGTCSIREPIASWTTTRDPKGALQNGPIVTGCNWDFPWFYYDSGIINDYTGDVAGGHALCIVGYDDSQNCWIVKNSWGTIWGESGFFRIDYNTAAEAGFGTDYPWYVVTVKNQPGPVPPGPVPPAPSQNKTYSAKTLGLPSGAYAFGEVSPDNKSILTTKAFMPAVKFGSYTSSQAFTFDITSKYGTFYTDKTLNKDKKSHSSIIPTTNGFEVVWQGIGLYAYKTDAIIEVSKS
jgi:hypothetical protein